jgi:hypothetical protein
MHRSPSRGGFGHGLGLARGDIDLRGSGGEEPFGNHFADPARSAGDDGHTPFKAEQPGKIHYHPFRFPSAQDRGSGINIRSASRRGRHGRLASPRNSASARSRFM